LTLSLTTLIELQYLKNDNAAAAETSQQLVSVIEELVARDPRRFRRALAQANHNLGYLCYKVRRLEVGLEYTLKGLAIREEIAVQDPELICLDLAWSYHNAGSFYLDLSDVENAITNCRRAFELRRQSMATNPGTFVSKVIDNAKTLADLFQRKGKMDEATHWWQVAVESSADADSMTQAVIGAEHAVFLHTNCSIESAVLAAKMAIKDFRQVLTECDPVQAPAKFAEVASRLCYLLLTVCNWSKDPSLLPEVERVARQAVGLIDPEMDNCRYSWIALVLNRGYALFRQGELESDRQLMTKGIESLDKACTYQLENDVQEASVTDHAKNLAGMYQKVGNIDRAANWWQVAVKSSVGVDATTQGLIEVGHADFLHIIDATEAAIQSAKRAEINFRKVLKECDAQAAPEKYAMAACNVCHSLILIGDWSENPGQLFEAEEIAGRAISLISPEVAVCRYNWGALLHNIGHALYRRGELESNRQLIARGIKSLEEAYNFQEENDMEVADLTAKILEKARRALAS
jgi:tetratricopeptide (TPR) repeat protein